MKAKKKIELDYHEGLTMNQVQIILKELNLSFSEFGKWMYGQTCPLILKRDYKGNLNEYAGVYEYDLFRWIAFKQGRERKLVFD